MKRRDSRSTLASSSVPEKQRPRLEGSGAVLASMADAQGWAPEDLEVGWEPECAAWELEYPADHQDDDDDLDYGGVPFKDYS